MKTCKQRQKTKTLWSLNSPLSVSCLLKFSIHLAISQWQYFRSDVFILFFISFSESLSLFWVSRPLASTPCSARAWSASSRSVAVALRQIRLFTLPVYFTFDPRRVTPQVWDNSTTCRSVARSLTSCFSFVTSRGTFISAPLVSSFHPSQMNNR